MENVVQCIIDFTHFVSSAFVLDVISNSGCDSMNNALVVIFIITGYMKAEAVSDKISKVYTDFGDENKM